MTKSPKLHPYLYHHCITLSLIYYYHSHIIYNTIYKYKYKQYIIYIIYKNININIKNI